MRTLLTNEEFQRLYKEKLEEHPILKQPPTSGKPSLNVVVWLLKQMETDFLLIYWSNGGFCYIPSVRETLIPTIDLVKKVKSITCYDNEEAEYPTLNIEFYKGR